MSEKIVPNKLIIQEQVKSKTSGNVYTVGFYDNCVFCTCPAGGKKQLCKHIIALTHKHFEVLKENCPDFLEKLLKTIEIKSNKGIPYEEKLKEYAKIMFLNKDIVKESIDNIGGLIESDIDELEQFLPIVDGYRLFELYELMRLSTTSLYNVFFIEKCNVFSEMEKCGFIEFHELSFEDFIKNVTYTKDYLFFLLNNANIQCPKSAGKKELLDLVKKYNLLEKEIENYCAVCATEKFVTSKKIRSFLFKNRSKYVENKEVLTLSLIGEKIRS